jgi:opacity protein-like surface antigen
MFASPEVAMPIRTAALLAFIIAAPCVAQDSASTDKPGIFAVSRDTTFRLRGAGWFSSADGSFSVGDAIPGTISDIDLEDDLDLDTDQTVVWATLGFNLGESRRWHIDLGYTGHLDYDGTSDPIEISFNDQVFSGNVESHAELDIYEFSLRYDLIQDGPFTLHIGPGLRVFDFEASVQGTATDPSNNTTQFRTEDESGIIPLPGLGLGIRDDITEQLYIRAAAQGIYAGDYGNYFDGAAELGFDLNANFGIFVGYRWLHAEADIDDLEFDVNLPGPYAGAELRF